MLSKPFAASIGLLALTISLGANATGATVLDFTGLGLSNYNSIPVNYGSRAAQTPNVEVSYRSYNFTTGDAVYNYLNYWANGYGSMSGVGYAVENGLGGEIRFRSDPGYYLTLESFQMAASGGSNLNATVKLVDESGNLLLDLGSPVSISGTTYTQFNPNYSRAGVLRLQFGADWHLGIDNITFSQTVVPEPTSLALAGTAVIVAYGAIRMRKSKAKATA